MSKVWHILGNGDKASYYNEAPREGKLLLCNMPPFEVPRKKVYATTMVDFKMMMALTEGSIALDQYDWILGTRPRIWMYEQSNFYMKYAHCVKDFYTHVAPCLARYLSGVSQNQVRFTPQSCQAEDSAACQHGSYSV